MFYRRKKRIFNLSLLLNINRVIVLKLNFLMTVCDICLFDPSKYETGYMNLIGRNVFAKEAFC